MASTRCVVVPIPKSPWSSRPSQVVDRQRLIQAELGCQASTISGGQLTALSVPG